ncbi:MAG: hypothetical protein QM756_02385 [Polyangiaceae bacterium]
MTMLARWCHPLLLCGCVALSTACSAIPPLSAQVGARGAHLVMNGQKTSYGPRSPQTGAALDLRVYPVLNDEHWYVGGEEALLTEWGTPCCDVWHVHALAGYAWVPRNPLSSVGLDLGAHVGFAKIPVNDYFATSWVSGVRATPLFKLLCNECDASSLVTYRLLLAPELGVTLYQPLSSAVRVPQTELHVGLALRFDVTVLQ